MMRKELISVIIPGYNSEQYLKRCFDSVLLQTYSNFEIIFIDDGSTDGSKAIYDEYRIKNPKKFKAFYKKNGGLSSARNYGIEKARGRYLSFIDSDDFIDNNYLEYLYDLMKTYNVKLAACNHQVVYRKSKKTSCERSEKLTNEEFLSRMLYHENIYVSACGKLYDKTIFTSLRFPDGKLYEDLETISRATEKCDYIAFGHDCKYSYVIRKKSLTTSSFNKRNLYMVEAVEIMTNEILKNHSALRYACMRKRISVRLAVLCRIPMYRKEYNAIKREFIKYIRDNKTYVIQNSQASIRDKIAILSLSFGFIAYRIAWRIYKISTGRS